MIKIQNFILKQNKLFAFAFLPIMLGASGLLSSTISIINPNRSHGTMSQSELYSEKIEKIRTYMNKRYMPLANNAEDFVLAANKYGLDYNLVAAMAVMESSGGKALEKGGLDHGECKYNPLGWGSCDNGYEYNSYKEAIYDVSAMLSGAKPSKYYNASMTIKEKLAKYNSVNPTYYDKVMLIMKGIDNQEI